MITVPHSLLAAQIRAVFLAWGMRPQPVETAVDLMVEPTCGDRQHGAMLQTYDQARGRKDRPLAEGPRSAKRG